MIDKFKCDIADLKPRQFEITKELFKEESILQQVDLKVIQLRAEILIKFNQVFSGIIKFINLSERSTEGSLPNKHFSNRNLALAQVINQIIDTSIMALPEGGRADATVNRRKAQVFADEGKIDHEGKYSIFGQILQSMKSDRF